MMETEQNAGSCTAPGQSAVRTWLFSSTRETPRLPSDVTRFSGEGVRYKAKLIGVDAVPDAHGDKMCWDSMMKLKGLEEAVRRQGKHKQRIWLKVSSSGLKIVDEKTGAVLQDHDRSRITSLMKDQSDPRALAYVYQHHDSFSLFYIKMASLADPVLADITEVCQVVGQETTPEEPAETPKQNDSILLLNGSSAPPTEGSAAEDIFSSQSDSPAPQINQTSSSSELLEVFSTPVMEPIMSTQSSCVVQPESPQPKLSSSQILSMFPQHPVGGSPYSSPPYSPTNMPWVQHGLQGNQWAGPAVAPWPAVPSGLPTWSPANSQTKAPGSQPELMRGGNTPTSPTAVNGFPTALNHLYVPTGPTVPHQSAPPILDQYLK
ncbi:disabled homolog 2-like [Antennarius striatus]|uniref:disabled homolog 2-like n=1 Tax=Antennarius striatus TaxID=241820 RepID=UPI0035B31CEF